ncbi:hypothetical protein L3Q82_020913 [Scortum barcoo]|uniref:Uncharacterized protein n=1 Tax=Scortum barcoo TaxID=214431 RepID=A0ACB8VB31_9TELE|nr:hypothetical protein L3Q82_020913 [Scortum barcoo]
MAAELGSYKQAHTMPCHNYYYSNHIAPALHGPSCRWKPGFQLATVNYICGRVGHAMRKRNTNYHLCVPVRKRVAIAIWKLATGSDLYRTISHLFGVGLSTMRLICVQDFCNAVIMVLLPDMMFGGLSRILGFELWCQQNDLQIDARKPKELVMDFHRRKHFHDIGLPVNIQGKDTEMVKPYSLSFNTIVPYQPIMGSTAPSVTGS